MSVLKLLKETALRTADILEAIPTPGYNYPSLRAGKARHNRRLREKYTAREARRRENQRFYNALYYLKQNNLIKEKERDGSLWLSLTPRGWIKLSQLNNLRREPVPKADYKLEDNSGLVMVAFDIPERSRRKRDWLRDVLRNMNFKMIQKSVWIGQGKIPKEFLEDLKALEIISCVEVFAINTKGKLEKI